MTRTLYGLSQSPWTERARWALEHHGVVYGYHEHLPMVGELLLRRKARTRHATVPLLADGDTIVMGSAEIAEHAESVGRGTPLFPPESRSDVARWTEIAERMTRAGRAWILRRLLESRDAQAESLPSFLPASLRGVIAPSAGMAVRFLVKKYDVPADAQGEIDRTARPLLEQVREGLGNRRYLLPAFSYADIAVASTLQILRPRAAAKLAPATRAAWTNDALARDFEDLVAWRDAIYEKHR